MYQAEICVDQEKDCVLTELIREFGEPLNVDIEELHNHSVTFVIRDDELISEYYTYLGDAPSVERVKRLDDEHLLVTKQSCGAYSAVCKNHGVLRRPTKITRHQRIYTVLFFERTTLRDIIADFRDVGSVQLARLTTFSESDAALTDRQREVVTHAYENGYFDWPRDTDSETLATDLDITHGTFLEHLRKAERKLIRRSIEDEELADRSQAPDVPHASDV